MLIIAYIYWFLPAPYGARTFFVGPKRDDSEVQVEEKLKKISVVNEGGERLIESFFNSKE